MWHTRIIGDNDVRHKSTQNLIKVPCVTLLLVATSTNYHVVTSIINIYHFIKMPNVLTNSGILQEFCWGLDLWHAWRLSELDDFHPSYVFLSPPHSILFVEHNLVCFAWSIFGLVCMATKEAIQNGMICSLFEFGSWDDVHPYIHTSKKKCIKGLGLLRMFSKRVVGTGFCGIHKGHPKWDDFYPH